MGAVMLQEDELLKLEGKLVYAAFLGGGQEVEPYLVFGPQGKIYGLEGGPELAEYNQGWVAFDSEPTREQVEWVRQFGSK